jgi:glycosyltransferase 2 family protein
VGDDELTTADLASVVAPPPVPRAKRWRGLALRLLGSLAMLAVLVWQAPDFEADKLVPEWRASTPWWLFGASAFTLGAIVLSSMRWQAVLTALGVRSHLGGLIKHYLAGQFVSNVLPTTIGGDVLRVSRLSKENGETPASFASVVLERLTGWLILPVLTYIGFVVNPGLTHLGTATSVALSLASATLVLLVVLLLLVASHRFGAKFGGNEGWRRFAGAVHLGLERLRHHPGAAFNVLAVGFAYQLALVVAALFAAKAVGMGVEVGPTALLAFFPAVAIAQVLPVGISGLGIREGAFALFLSPLGVPTEQAVALGLLLYLLNLGVSLLGAPAFAFGGRAPAVPPAAVTA